MRAYLPLSGIGFNVTKLLETLTIDNIRALQEMGNKMWTQSFNTAENRTDINITKYLIRPITPDNKAEYDLMLDTLKNYEDSDKNRHGAASFIVDIFKYEWELHGHTAPLVASDEIGSDDLCIIVPTVYPWHQCESFQTREECSEAIVSSFDDIITTDDIKTYRIRKYNA